jgi:hypothetical protein
MMIVDNQMLWRQFGAAIDGLETAMRDCPDELWAARLWPDQEDHWVAAGFSSFWYIAYHTLFWIDLYLTGAEDGFRPPEPFDLVEMADDEVLPRTYGREELLDYLALCRERTRQTIVALTAEGAERLCRFPWGELPYGELLLYTMRHVQEHVAHLSMFLGQQTGRAAGWATQTA